MVSFLTIFLVVVILKCFTKIHDYSTSNKYNATFLATPKTMTKGYLNGLSIP